MQTITLFKGDGSTAPIELHADQQWNIGTAKHAVYWALSTPLSLYVNMCCDVVVMSEKAGKLDNIVTSNWKNTSNVFCRY